MKKILILVSMALAMAGCSTHNSSESVEENMNLMDSYNNFEVLSEIIDSAKNDNDVDVVRLWERNIEDGTMTKILETIRDSEVNAWYLPDGNKFIPISIDSIPVASSVKIWRDNPLQLIVSGCPDNRNIHSFFIDVALRKAWYVPANSDFMGETEEGYMVFSSYRYVSDPEIGGRYTFLQIFNDRGEMVDSLSLEHLHK